MPRTSNAFDKCIGIGGFQIQCVKSIADRPANTSELLELKLLAPSIGVSGPMVGLSIYWPSRLCGFTLD